MVVRSRSMVYLIAIVTATVDMIVMRKMVEYHIPWMIEILVRLLVVAAKRLKMAKMRLLSVAVAEMNCV